MAQKTALVAGIELTWDGCLVAVYDVTSGAPVRTGRAPLVAPNSPAEWWRCVSTAVVDAGAFADVAAFALTAPTALVCLDADGDVLHVDHSGRPLDAARALHVRDPETAARVEAVLTPQDWLTWLLRGFGAGGPHGPRLEELVTDRSAADATGWWDGTAGRYDHGRLADALGHPAIKPRVMRPDGWGGEAAKLPELGIRTGRIIGVGAHPLAAAMLGVAAGADEAILLRGTRSALLCARVDDPVAPAGDVVCRADATGGFGLSVALPAEPTDADLGAAVDALRSAGADVARVRTPQAPHPAVRGMAAQAAWAHTRTLPVWPQP